QRAELSLFLAGVATDHENNSLLLVGGRGTGKTALLESCLAELNSPSLAGASSGGQGFLVARIPGGIVQDDDAALREISRQLSLAVPHGIEDDEDGTEDVVHETQEPAVSVPALAGKKRGRLDDIVDGCKAGADGASTINGAGGYSSMAA